MRSEWVTLITVVFYVSGVTLAFLALWRTRTPQGAAAWVVGLLGFPFIAVPAFLVFGRNKFYGYVKERKELDEKAQTEMKEVDRLFAEHVEPPKDLLPVSRVALQARQPGFTRHNRIRVLGNAEQAYASMLDAIASAEKYILFQFYIFREDQSGQRFKEILTQKAKEGVRVCFLYDQIGTKLSSFFVREMESYGIEIVPFQSSKSWSTRFQINFRNHRKVVVVDGKIAFVGGLNIGDDYLGQWESIGSWRDAHVKMEGPSALAAQLAFAKDWHWAKGAIPDLDWYPHRCDGGSDVLVLHTGPADESEACLLTHLSLIQSATKRVWISNPYFVPSEGLMNALALAALKGIDVRILIPSYSDNAFVMAASQVYVEKLLKSGVRFYRYMDGFLHQKAVLIDDRIAMVGSANLDFRSLFINFEIMAVSTDAGFVDDIHHLFDKDFCSSEVVSLEFFANRPTWRKFLDRAANLFAPLL